MDRFFSELKDVTHTKYYGEKFVGSAPKILVKNFELMIYGLKKHFLSMFGDKRSTKSISNNYCKAIFGPPNVTFHAPAASPNAQVLQKFFEVATVVL